MVQTCLRLAEYHGLGGTAPKVVVWAHNSHCGDASATEIGAHNEWNLGQMLRQTFGSDNTFIVGFGTHEGTVTAADEWGEPAETFELSHAEEGSISSIMHAAMPAVRERTGDATLNSCCILLSEQLKGGRSDEAAAAAAAAASASAASRTRASATEDQRRGVAGTAEVAEAFSEPRRQRAIGVCYKRGEREATSHYFHATLTQQVDAWVHVDRSTALAHFDA
jgi:erythromycin esterase-like protein